MIIFCKNPKNLDTQNICTRWLYHRLLDSDDADGMANSVDPDQTAPSGANSVQQPDQTAPESDLGLEPASVHASVHTFKHEYLRDQQADYNQILSEASLGGWKAALGFDAD